MTGITIETVRYFAEAAESGNAFGVTGLLDKYGNVIGIVLAVFGLIMLYFSFKARSLGGFVVDMMQHETIIKENGFELATAKIGESRSLELGDKTFNEVQLLFELEGETYEKWTPDLGFADWVNIEYNPDDPSDFYITDKVEGEQTADVDEDGQEVKDESKPANMAFIAMLIFSIVLIGLGGGFLYDFYFIR